MNETVANVFYRSDSRDAQEQHRIRWVLDHFLTIGVVRMRQVRVKAEACNVPKTYADEFAECYPSYNTKTKDKDPCKPHRRTPLALRQISFSRSHHSQ